MQEKADRELDEALAAADKPPEEEKAADETKDADVETKTDDTPADPDNPENADNADKETEEAEKEKELTPEEIAAAEKKAKEEAAQAEADARARELMALRPQEHVLIVCGAKAGGKSTFIQGFLNPARDPASIKPTTALEYAYGRKV